MKKQDPWILGGAQTDFARSWSKDGDPLMALLRSVTDRGLAGADLDLEELRRLRDGNRIGVFVGNFTGEKFLNQGHLGAFMTEVDEAFHGMPGARYEAACASGSVALDAARAKIAAGDLDLAMVVGVEVMKTVNPAVCNDYLGLAADYEAEAKGVRFVFPKIFGRLTDEIIARSPDIGEERVMDCLAEVSRINYENARRNPHAQTRETEFGPEEREKIDKKYAKTFGGRTRYSDCSQVTDGAAAVFLASGDYAREYLNKRGRESKSIARMSGWGHRVAPVSLEAKLNTKGPDIMPITRRAVSDAYGRAGIAPGDIDVIETHDCFTSSEYLALSAFGLAEPGEEYRVIEEGDIQAKGKTPVNASGGLIGAGHPVGATGVRMALDLYKQTTDRAGDYQVEDAKRGAMLNIGGSFTTNMTFVVERGSG